MKKYSNDILDLAIIGAGAAGLFLGASFDALGKNALKAAIIESTSNCGTKLLMSGSGQCNITHGGDIKDFPAAYGKTGKKLRGMLFKYSNEHLMNFMEEHGVKLMEREDQKVFPKSLDAKEIRDMLLETSVKNGFEIIKNFKVDSIAFEEGVYTLGCQGEYIKARKVVIATGGASYHRTGSDGAMWQVLSDGLGIEIESPRPALSSIKVEGYPFAELSGISFPNATIKVFDGKMIAKDKADLLLTHKGFSGPVIINNSKYVEAGNTIEITYLEDCEKYEDSEKELTQEITGLLGGHSPEEPQAINILAKEYGIPKRFLEEISANCKGAKELAKRLLKDTYTVTSPGSFNDAMVTTGGIKLGQLDLKTMEFKNFPGLYAIGEVVDVDAITGGYNLQFAYSSARACGEAIK